MPLATSCIGNDLLYSSLLHEQWGKNKNIIPKTAIMNYTETILKYFCEVGCKYHVLTLWATYAAAGGIVD